MIEELNNLQPLITTTGTIIATLTAAYTGHVKLKESRNKRRTQKIEIGLQKFEEDSQIMQHLEKLEREVYFQSLYDINIKESEIDKLIKFFDENDVNSNEVKLIWPYRKIDSNGNLNLALDKVNIALFWIVKIAMVLTYIVAVCSFMLAHIATQWQNKVMCFSGAILMLLILIAQIHITKDIRAVSSIKKRKQQKEEN